MTNPSDKSDESDLSDKSNPSDPSDTPNNRATSTIVPTTCGVSPLRYDILYNPLP